VSNMLQMANHTTPGINEGFIFDNLIFLQ
jgi:hypothetical protein